MSNFEYFVSKYRRSQLLIDANLLVLLLVGRSDINFIQKVKPTQKYSKEDYILLTKLVTNFNVVATPHILTEVSNLCEKIDKYYREIIFDTFSKMIIGLIEVSIPSKDASVSPVFLKLGLSDGIIYELSKKGLVVLTDDFELHSYIVNTGGTAANMNLFRGEYLLS